MIVEATQTYSPGNVELLVYVLSKIENNEIICTVYLGHDYTYKILDDFAYKYIKVQKTSGIDTAKRFLKKRENVLFFCSYPPVLKQHNSLVYFHSLFFANPFKFLNDKKLSTKIKFTRFFVYGLIRFFHRNVDFFYCQTNAIEKELKNSFSGISVKKMPFFNDSALMQLKQDKSAKFEYDFFYPATADIHKNYFRLFDAVQILAEKKTIKLCVTIDVNATPYINKIDEINKNLNYEAIVNIGRVSKNIVLELYLKSKALVFPSLEESLGLPLIEASFVSCPIIGSNLPYIYDVVENPIVFNPLDIIDIADKMNRFLDGEFDNIRQKNKIDNKVQEIITYFQ